MTLLPFRPGVPRTRRTDLAASNARLRRDLADIRKLVEEMPEEKPDPLAAYVAYQRAREEAFWRPVKIGFAIGIVLGLIRVLAELIGGK